MTKIVYNACFGGFSLSHKAIMRYAEIKGMPLYAFAGDSSNKMRRISDEEATDIWCVHYCTTPEYSDEHYFSDREIQRDDPALAQAVEELGDEANGSCAKLRVEELVSGTLYRIDEYDGRETIETAGDISWKVA